MKTTTVRPPRSLLFNRLAALACLTVLAATATPVLANDVVIHAGTLLDSVTDAPRHQVSILVHDDKIQSVVAGFVAPVPTLSVYEVFYVAARDHPELLTPGTAPKELAPLQALHAATRDAADLLGASDQVGSVQAGRFADLVATSANPLDDPAQLAHVSFVMKGGVVYRSGGAATATPN
jgi:adenine deaminase